MTEIASKLIDNLFSYPVDRQQRQKHDLEGKHYYHYLVTPAYVQT